MHFIDLAFLLICSILVCANSIEEWGTEPLEDGARCDINAVRRANREQLHLLLEELTNTTFFRLFRVGLDGVCPTASPIPEPDSCGKQADTCTIELPTQLVSKGLPTWALNKQPVDRTMSSKEKFSLEDDLSCEAPDFWFDMCDGLMTNDPSKGWINLQLNPERHTGYNGSKVWKQIYEQACFAQEKTNNSKGDDVVCHEERVFHRLLSGLHASINTHISLFFYPPPNSLSSSSNENYKPNPRRFMETVGSHPDRIKNLNFLFVVLLRSLSKARSVLSSFSYAVSTDPSEDLRTAALVRRLLDSHLLSSCSQVFDSFDESSMFQNRTSELKKEFKKAFHAISKTFDCIGCQKCKLHGKLQLTGIGTALKILLLPENVLSKTSARREEIVALFNTLYKVSHAISAIDYLTELHFSKVAQDALLLQAQEKKNLQEEVLSRSMSGQTTLSSVDIDSIIKAISNAFFKGLISGKDEKELLKIAVRGNSHVLTSLAKYYGDTDRFAEHVKELVLTSLVSSPLTGTSFDNARKSSKVIVVGSGLAGSTALLSLLDSNQIEKLILIEKQPFLGGNSVYASSGMNAVDDETRALGDSEEIFAQDMAKSSGRGESFAKTPLVKVLTSQSEKALEWVRSRGMQPFPSLGRLGGHSKSRTHRPEHGMAGAELVYTLHRLFKPYLESGKLEILKSTRLVDIILDHNQEPSSVKIISKNMESIIDNVSAVIIATGGFAANKTLLPSWMQEFGTTNGPFTTGDALEFLKGKAGFVDLDIIQLHPTAFVAKDDSQGRLGGAQPLCAEILRGVGGILLNRAGERFCDELGTRAYVSKKMLDTKEKDFVILLSAEQAAKSSHVETYVKRGFLTEFSSIEDVKKWMEAPKLENTLRKYENNAMHGKDEFGKTTFPNFEEIATSKRYYAGKVQPAVHYCMGGVAIDDSARVLNKEGIPIPGLYAAGEVTGGLHGNNRLGGNGMTESVVFGRRAAETVLLERFKFQGSIVNITSKDSKIDTDKRWTLQDLSKHSKIDDCYVSIAGKVYDFTSFIKEHPGGAQAILDVAGKDGTEVYQAIHTMTFLDDFKPIGDLI